MSSSILQQATIVWRQASAVEDADLPEGPAAARAFLLTLDAGPTIAA